MFLVLSATLLEKTVEGPRWRLAVPRLVAQRIVGFGSVLSFVAALTTTVFAHRLKETNVFHMTELKLFHYVSKCQAAVAANGVFTDIIGRLFTDGSLDIAGCGQWFFTAELRAWSFAIALLALPFGGTGPLLVAIGLLWRAWVQADDTVASVKSYQIYGQTLVYLVAVILARVSRKVWWRACSWQTALATLSLLAALVAPALRRSERFRHDLSNSAVTIIVLRLLQSVTRSSLAVHRGFCLAWLADHALTINAVHLPLFAFLASFEEELVRPRGLPLLRVSALASVAVLALSL
eukprot:CAMPEP_0180526572 /NCGR_PEP_ID=MMETSP1036_2-20121128/59763_1 /TAXON_ID=632150 /ORGANISM="Azadinium spinosum, Strain 3D9" /LENGTH=292 /DNA_ID=CAMNT_0022539927 /DNA_START=55 /DNA_END=930 /DNA_ORIENTATION=-